MSVRSTRALEQKADTKPMASCRVRQGSAPAAGNGSGERDISDAERRIGTAATPVVAFLPVRPFGSASRSQMRLGYLYAATWPLSTPAGSAGLAGPDLTGRVRSMASVRSAGPGRCTWCRRWPCRACRRRAGSRRSPGSARRRVPERRFPRDPARPGSPRARAGGLRSPSAPYRPVSRLRCGPRARC